MASAIRSVVIARPQAEVFDYLADPSRHHEWNLSLLRTEMVDDGPIGVGTRAVEVRRMLGREVRSPFVITRHEAPDRQDFHVTGGPVRLDGSMRCADEAGSTRVSYEFVLPGPLAPLMIIRLRRDMETNLANLKRVLEQLA